MSETETHPSDILVEQGDSIIVDRVFASGRTERWVFAGWDTIGNANGLHPGKPRPHHFPVHLWEEVEYRRATWPERHPRNPDDKFQWVKNKAGNWLIWGAPVCPY